MLDRVRLPLPPLPRPGRPSAAGLGLAVAGIVLSTLLAALLQSAAGIPNAAIVYLLAVVAVGLGYGSWYAIGTAVCAFLAYDFFFVEPRHTFTAATPEGWLDLLLFLIVGVLIGRLSALQLQRRREAELRSAEARAMYAVSREMATASTALEAAPRLTARLVREAEMSRVWIALGPSVGEEHVIADSSPELPRPSLASRWVLHSLAADGMPNWGRVREMVPGARAVSVPGHDPVEGPKLFRVPITAGNETKGSLWATRSAGDPFPGRSHSRLLATAADQLGQAVVRDRLAAEATAAEVARQSDAFKSALLDSVSHDLRTPLAAIRATAGNLADQNVQWTPDGQRAAAESIDREAERLSRLVRNMLDLSRIEGNALHPMLELYELADLVEPVVERMQSSINPPNLQVDVPADLPAVRVDGLFIDQILTNLIDNAASYAAGAPIRVSARVVDDCEELVVEDGGPGVPKSQLDRIFERFYRAPGRDSRAGGGSGIGLAVVRGLAEAMGATAAARRSALGGLAVVLRLPIEAADAVEPTEPTESTEPSTEATEPGPGEPDEPAEPADSASDGQPVPGLPPGKTSS